jgi:DNA-binding NtrC family response regulator
MTDTLLVIDDEASIRHAIARAFPQHQVLAAEDIASGLERMRDGYPDLVLLDQRLPDGLGIDAIPQLRSIDPEVPIIIMTGSGSTDVAVDSLKGGAADYLEKPFKLERLRLSVDNLMERQQLGRQVARLSGAKRSARTQLVAHSGAMKRVLSLIKRVAGVPGTTVLIQGESGVGKEVVAKGIHERAARSAKEFIAINCAALSENLLEAELFGYEKGAFTGADQTKDGLFEAAHGGTIFLDEVGEMPLPLQSKLLRVLQERRFRHVGGLKDIEVDVRVVAATNRDLRREVVLGTFRKDLYYRLRVVPIMVPPLRDRPEDILPLADHLLKRLAPELGRPGMVFSDETRAAMRGYAWPGNVRELANAVERAVITAGSDVIHAADLVMDEELVVESALGAPPQQMLAALAAEAAPPAAPALEPGSIVIPPGQRHLGEIEQIIIRATLEESGGRKTQAADQLGINRTTLYNKLRDLDAGSGPADEDEASEGAA